LQIFKIEIPLFGVFVYNVLIYLQNCLSTF